MKKLLFVYVFLMAVLTGSAQNNEIGFTFNLASIDYDNLEVCYHATVQNLGSNDVVLAGQNLRFYYDWSSFTFLRYSLSSLLPSSQYSDVFFVQNSEVDATGLGSLGFESTLGFINCFIDLNDVVNGGITLPVNGASVPIMEVCFLVDISVSDEVCPSLVGARPDLTGSYAAAFIEISGWVSSSNQETLNIVSFDDILSTTGSPDCIDFVENTLEACTDGGDNDGDGLVDCMDTSCNAIGITCENDMASCTDGMDNDGDGDIDCDDMTCGSPTLIDFVLTPISNCPDQNNGSVIINADGLNLVYSIDNGATFQSDPTFNNLNDGTYTIVIRNDITSCALTAVEAFTLDQIECTDDTETDCADGIDNDLNGFIDCDDIVCFDVSQLTIEVDSTCADDPQGAIFLSNINTSYGVSIDNGSSFVSFGELVGLDVGFYTLIIRSDIYSCLYTHPETIEIPLKECITASIEICFDGVDNDLNGFIDCEDPACIDLEDCQQNILFVPNAFSPTNMDGVNDLLIIGIDTNKVASLDRVTVFNRLGNKLYDRSFTGIANNQIETWNGTFNNSIMNPALYLVHIEYTLASGSKSYQSKGVALF